MCTWLNTKINQALFIIALVPAVKIYKQLLQNKSNKDTLRAPIGTYSVRSISTDYSVGSAVVL